MAKAKVKDITSSKATSKNKVSKKAEVEKNEKKLKSKEKEVDSDENIKVSIEKKLHALYSLQLIDSQIDKIRIIRGELPLEVQDLEDEIAGLETRVENFKKENEDLEKSIQDKNISITNSKSLMEKYEDQRMNVRNNREYDSLTKEIEFQNLEIQLCEKRIKEHTISLDNKKIDVDSSQQLFIERKKDLEIKKGELKDITAETEKEEKTLVKKSEENQKFIEERLLTAYKRIRINTRNGLAVVLIERDACGGCFNKIPPQRHLDIRMHKKIIVCEYCGRILVDNGIKEYVDENFNI